MIAASPAVDDRRHLDIAGDPGVVIGVAERDLDPADNRCIESTGVAAARQEVWVDPVGLLANLINVHPIVTASGDDRPSSC